MARTRRHDADAGGPAEIVEAKHAVRQRVWDALRDGKIARFPGAHGRIPNFVGAEAAAERLRATDVWKQARTLKGNPDSAQWPVRQRALEDGKTVYMAVPRLAEEAPFFLLDPDDLDDSPAQGVVDQGRLAVGAHGGDRPTSSRSTSSSPAAWPSPRTAHGWARAAGSPTSSSPSPARPDSSRRTPRW